MSIAEISLNFMGEEFIAEVEYTVTSKYYPATPPSLNYPGDPPEGPEWEINEIVLYRDLPLRTREREGEPPRFVVKDGALFNHLCNSCERINDKLAESIIDDQYSDWDDYDYDWDE